MGGDVVVETMEPTMIHVCPGYLDLHDPTCPSVIVERHETIPDLQAKGWENTSDLWPDNHGKYGSNEDYAKANANPSVDDTHTPDTVTVLYCYYRKGTETERGYGGTRKLDPKSQYMRCDACGLEDRAHERMPDGSLPDWGMPCPQCMNQAPPTVSYMYRVGRETLTDERLKYPKGKLCIVAPYQQREFYKGAWQAPCRSFPIWQQRAYESPYEQRGGTDTLIYWTLQTLMDQLRRQGYEQMVTSKPLIIMAGGQDGEGLLDANGQPFIMSDDNGQIAYSKWPTITGMVQHVQSPGLPAAFPQLYQIIAGSFYQTKSTGQVSFSPEQSRDVAYSSLRLQQETGDVPIDYHREIVFQEEGMFLGCILDLIVHNGSLERFERTFGPQAKAALNLLRAEPAANVDVIVGTSPSIRQGAADEVKTMIEWSNIPSAAIRKEMAGRLGLSPAVVAEVEAEKKAAPPPGGPMNGVPAPAQLAATGAVPGSQ